jgi:hypothetical protein
MARGIADVNGLGVPGEETNGGDYAMAIGALAGLACVEVLLGFEARGDRATIRPCLPSALDRVVVDGLTLGERRFRVEVARAPRRRAGRRRADRARRGGADDDRAHARLTAPRGDQRTSATRASAP